MTVCRTAVVAKRCLRRGRNGRFPARTLVHLYEAVPSEGISFVDVNGGADHALLRHNVSENDLRTHTSPTLALRGSGAAPVLGGRTRGIP